MAATDVTQRAVSSRLENFLSASRRRMAEREAEVSLAQIRQRAEERPDGRPFMEALARSGTSLISEYKRRSPSKGTIREDLSVPDVARAYERGGAAALSVITEVDHWGGTLADLEAARAVTQLPILRKDFTLEPYQVYEAASAGADAVLLVVAALGSSLEELYSVCESIDLDALVEVRNEAELERALEIDADVIGINNRDLETLEVELETTERLSAEIPTGKTIVAESGISTRAQIEQFERIGIDAVLVGEAVMLSADQEAKVRNLSGHEEPTQA